MSLPYGIFVQEGKPVRTFPHAASGLDIFSYRQARSIIDRYARHGFLVESTRGGLTHWYVQAAKNDTVRCLNSLEDGMDAWSDKSLDLARFPLVRYMTIDPDSLVHRVLLLDAVPYDDWEMFGKAEAAHATWLTALG